MHKNIKKRRKTQPVHKPTTVHVQKKKNLPFTTHSTSLRAATPALLQHQAQVGVNPELRNEVRYFDERQVWGTIYTISYDLL